MPRARPSKWRKRGIDFHKLPGRLLRDGGGAEECRRPAFSRAGVTRASSSFATRAEDGGVSNRRVLRGCEVESGDELPLVDGAPASTSLNLRIARVRRITSDSGM